MTRRPSRKAEKRARRLAARRPDHDRRLVLVVCLPCGRQAPNEMRHVPTVARPDLLLRGAGWDGARPGKAGLATVCRCGGVDARYAEAL